MYIIDFQVLFQMGQDLFVLLKIFLPELLKQRFNVFFESVLYLVLFLEFDVFKPDQELIFFLHLTSIENFTESISNY